MSKTILYSIVVFALLSAALIAYFVYANPSPLVGNWRLDFSDVAAGSLMKSDLGQLDSSNEQAPTTFINEYFMRVEFFRDGTFVTETDMPMGGSTHRGTWKTAASTDDRPTEIECVFKGDKIRIDINWVDNDTIEMVPPSFTAFKETYDGPRTFQRDGSK